MSNIRNNNKSFKSYPSNKESCGGKRGISWMGSAKAHPKPVNLLLSIA